MGLRFHKTIRIAKGLKINISSHGASVTIGKSPLSLSLSDRGVYANASIPKSGLSYRKKLFGRNSTARSLNPVLTEKQIQENTETVRQYEEDQKLLQYLHRYGNNVASYQMFTEHLSEIENPESRDLMERAISGDGQIIEQLLDRYNQSLQLPYPLSIDYQLQQDVLYADLDLPEIEDIDKKYPTLSHSREIMIKTKTITTCRQEYARIVLSLPIYLAAGWFNLTPYINTVILSGYTQLRNRDGDKVDTYLYSVKFTRDIFEQSDLSQIEDAYQFIQKFTNRINLVNGYSFKAITPYQNDKVEGQDLQSSIYIQEAVSGLKNLGYKNNEIQAILPQLRSLTVASSDDALKKALKLLAKGE